jgi:colanic acid/amylovoran biosynthesis protein
MKIVITNAVPLNAGDAAILRATIAILRQDSEDHDILVYGEQVEIAERFYPDLSFRRSLHGQLAQWAGTGLRAKFAAAMLMAIAFVARVTPGRWLAHLLPAPLRRSLEDYRTADAVISSGGTYLVPHYQMAPKLLDFLVTIALGRPLILFTQSLGPFESARRPWLVRWVLSRARLILLRDARSLQHLEALGVPTTQTRICADAAFALMERRSRSPLPNENPRVAISVREWPHFTNGNATQGMNRFIAAMAELVRMLVEERHAEVTFLSTCQGIGEYWTDDSRIAREIWSGLPEHLRTRVAVDEQFHTPEALRDRFRAFDLVVATRMHAAILALDAGTAVMPLAYEFKTSELFDRLGLGDLVLSIETADGPALHAAFQRAVERWSRSSEEIWARVAAEHRSAFEAGIHVRAALLHHAT